jgi:Glycosyltransferases involved in cell wall biogenesis
VPAYNESEGINDFHSKLLLPVLKKSVKNLYEIIYVNDGSKDDTLAKLNAIAITDKHVKVVNLSKNFGKEIALTAGIANATGDAIIILDSDGQHPPAIIPQFIKKWQAGAQVVIGVRISNTKEGVIKRWGSKMFYQIFNSTSGAEIVPRSTDFRLIDRVVANEFLRLTERNRISRGLIDWLGFERDYIEFDSPARLAGEASYNIRQLVKLAMNSFTSLSLKPLFFFGWLGLFITIFSLFVGIAIFIEQFLLGDPLALNFTGAALLGIFISFLVGIVLTSQGVIAIYLSHVHGQTQGRPLYIVNPKGSQNLG